MDLIEAEDIKKRWQEYAEELYKKKKKERKKKNLNGPDNHGVINHLEPDILLPSQAGLRKHHYEQS